MQIPPLLKSDHFYIKDEQCVESNEKSNLRFFWCLVFDLLASKRSKNMRKKLIQTLTSSGKGPQSKFIFSIFCLVLNALQKENTKSIISHKLKIVQKKIICAKIIVRSIQIFSVNLISCASFGTFWMPITQKLNIR